MQNYSLRIIAAIVGLTACVSAAGCSKSSKPSPQAKPVTSTASAQPSVIPTENIIPAVPGSTSPALRPVLSYLRSSERVQRFQTVVPKAGILIAQALQAGKLGPVFRYNDEKTALQPGQVGYGGIQSNNHAGFAWVYYKADGSIDYSKPITQISITNVNANPATNVQIMSPMEPVSNSDGFGTYWEVFKALDKNITEIGDTINLDLPNAKPNANDKKFYYPYTLQEFKQLDVEAFDQLDANMVSRFGAGWEK
jgi:hypothetical protein